ncbi:MAG: hypothetical protein JXR83_14440 [Deltaproteobacteria bacterium]|nr:hypothetical protein [Deltaproteobacteria bacterium]
MTSILLLCALATPATAEPPPWYAGRHAVLFIVDGLGDGTFEQLTSAGHLGQVKRLFSEGGVRVANAAAHWPGRGDDEARSVARGQRLDFEAGQSYLPPGLEAWPDAVFIGAATAGACAPLRAALPKPGSGAAPPALAVIHERRYALAIAQAGPGSPRAGEALAAIDRDISGVIEAYRSLGLTHATTFALISPGGQRTPIKRIDANALFAAWQPASSRRSVRLANLLQTFSPTALTKRGNLALLSRQGGPGSEAVGPAPTYQELWALSANKSKTANAALEDLARPAGIAFVVARERAARPDQRAFVVISRTGRVRIDEQQPPQYRYTVVTGSDPFALGDLPEQLGAGRFHAAEIWRLSQTAMRDPLARVAGLLDLVPNGGVAAVAQAGHSFDDRGAGFGPEGRALALFAGLGAPREPPAAMRTIDVMPTLLALIGAPLDPVLEGEVIEDFLEAAADDTVRDMWREMLNRALGGFAGQREHDASVVDTTELRRFGVPPASFEGIRRALLACDPEGFLPPLMIRQQIGPRRSLLHATNALAVRIEKIVLEVAPNDIRQFDPVLRPELMLAGFLDNPVMRSRLRILEGPYRRAERRSASAPAADAP